MRIPSKNRKAISPVLATVILIAITLIAAVAIAGFVFGLFGSFTSSAQVSVAVISCQTKNVTLGAGNCDLRLTNTGTSNVQVTACSIQDKGTSATGTLTHSPQTIPAGGSSRNGCQLAGQSSSAVGSQAIGSFSLSNGASVPFSGVWS